MIRQYRPHKGHRRSCPLPIQLHDSRKKQFVVCVSQVVVATLAFGMGIGETACACAGIALYTDLGVMLQEKTGAHSAVYMLLHAECGRMRWNASTLPDTVAADEMQRVVSKYSSVRWDCARQQLRASHDKQAIAPGCRPRGLGIHTHDFTSSGLTRGTHRPMGA